MTYRPIYDEEISYRIANLTYAPLGMATSQRATGEGDSFRISIAGMQEKTAFLYVDDHWQLPTGATPTSHIFKPAMGMRKLGPDFSDSPWNEWLCLNLCAEFGLISARSNVLHFNGIPVIVIERFDRHWQDGVLYRLPQEDLCQALGVPPAKKYESDGGPGILAILEFLRQAADPRADRLTFMKSQIVFWLLAAIDGHAKNYSIFLTPDGFSLTPLYDVMSAAPYPELALQKIKLAMAVGDNRHYRIHKIAPRHFYQIGRAAGFASDDMDEIFGGLSASIDVVLEKVMVEAERAGVPENTRNAIAEGVRMRTKLFR